MKRALLWILVSAMNTAFAQQPDSMFQARPVHVAIQVGAITDEAQTGFSFSVVPALPITRHLSIGAGIGWDAYADFRAVPLFGQLAYDLGAQKNKLRLAFAYGYAKAYLSDQALEFAYGYESTRGGRLVMPQLGYVINYDKVGVGFFVGMKFQHTSHQYRFPVYYDARLLTPGSGTSSEVQVDKRSGFFSLVVVW